MRIRHTASDAVGRVQVSVDQRGWDVRVAVLPGWRRADSEQSLGGAVLAAFFAAEAARRVAHADDPSVLVPEGSEPRSAAWTTPFALLHRAFRDLEEYRLQLRHLRESGTTVADPDRVVAVRLQGAQLVAVDIDASWLSSAGDAEVAQRVTAALVAAVRATRAQLDQALAGCPDLVTVLAGAPAADTGQRPGSQGGGHW